MEDKLTSFSEALGSQLEAVEQRTQGLTASLDSALHRITSSNNEMMVCSQKALSELQFQEPMSQDLLRTEHDVRKLSTLIKTGTCEDVSLADLDPSVGNGVSRECETGLVDLF